VDWTQMHPLILCKKKLHRCWWRSFVMVTVRFGDRLGVFVNHSVHWQNHDCATTIFKSESHQHHFDRIVFIRQKWLKNLPNIEIFGWSPATFTTTGAFKIDHFRDRLLLRFTVKSFTTFDIGHCRDRLLSFHNIGHFMSAF